MPTFSEQDAREVFARAAQLQQAAASDDPAASGLSLDELQEIGLAAGLDPAHIAAAAASLSGTVAVVPKEKKSSFGAPAEVRHTRRLPGPLSDAAWESIVEHLRAEFKTQGTAGQVGRIREWSGGDGRNLGSTAAAVHVAARPTPEGGTEITVEQRGVRQTAGAFAAAGGTLVILALVFAVLGATVEPVLWGAAAAIFAFALAMGGGGLLGTRAWAQRLDAQFEAVLDRIELVAREDAPAASTETVLAPPRVDLDALGSLPPEPEPERVTRNQTRS